MTITTLKLIVSNARSLYVSNGAKVTFGNAISMPSFSGSVVEKNGTLTFSNASPIKIGQNVKVQTSSTTAKSTFAGGFSTTSGVTGYSLGGTVTAENANICLNTNCYWSANNMDFSTMISYKIENEEFKIQLIPNPIEKATRLIVKISEKGEGKVTIRLSDISGKLVKSFSLNESTSNYIHR